jgi:hypothetical protein
MVIDQVVPRAFPLEIYEMQFGFFGQNLRNLIGKGRDLKKVVQGFSSEKEQEQRKAEEGKA